MNQNESLNIDISRRLNEIVKQRRYSISKLTNEVNEIFGKSDSYSDSTVRRFLTGENKPSAVFIAAFCSIFNVSPNYILGQNSSAVETETLTPIRILYNLVIVLKQCDLTFEKNDDLSKGMLITTNRGIIEFLGMLFSLSDYKRITPVDISKLCEIINLKMYNNKIVTNDEYYNLHGKAFAAFNSDKLSLKFEETEYYENERKALEDKCLSFWNDCSEGEKDNLIDNGYERSWTEEDLYDYRDL